MPSKVAAPASAETSSVACQEPPWEHEASEERPKV